MTEQNQKADEKNSFFVARWIFVRLVGLIYLMAFLSISAQMIGLIGREGILPAVDYLKAVEEYLGPKRFYQVPTFFWINASDGALRTVCLLGIVSSVMVILGVAQAFSVLMCWGLYLSIFSVGQVFLGFQWDILLLEVGLLTVFLAPWQIFEDRNRADPPSRMALLLLKWVLFRLMFESGVVKLLSGDQTWRDLTALTYHYFTQPLPNTLSWFVHQLPDWFHKTCCAVMFFIELVTPFCIFFMRWGRQTAFWCLTGLQIVILITGNYCFFNALAIALCVILVDDGMFRKLIPKWLRAYCFSLESRLGISCPSDLISQGGMKLVIKNLLVAMLGVMIGVVTSVHLYKMFDQKRVIAKPLLEVISWIQPLNSINSYGLFAVMTTTRREIIIEGSQDLKTWKTYEFKYKPGDLKRRPVQIAPYQPRLDWQMWFAALSDYRYHRWFLPFLKRLLEGSSAVTGLLEINPFAESPPKFIRAQFYDYEFTDGSTRRTTGQWWQRKHLGLYSPVLQLSK